MQRLLQRTICTPQLRAGVNLDTASLIDEVLMEYSYSMNGLLLQEGLTRPPLRDKVRADLLLPPAPPPVPDLGVIEIIDNTFVAASVHTRPRPQPPLPPPTPRTPSTPNPPTHALSRSLHP